MVSVGFLMLSSSIIVVFWPLQVVDVVVDFLHLKGARAILLPIAASPPPPALAAIRSSFPASSPVSVLQLLQHKISGP